MNSEFSIQEPARLTLKGFIKDNLIGLAGQI